MILNSISDLKLRAANAPRIVIIGSGAVGLYLAAELSKRGVEVIVIEAGGINLDSFKPETYMSIGKRHEGISTGRCKCLGGTTNLWGGQLVEFQPVDFNGREWMPGSKWPLSYEEITPYYKRTYTNLGFDENAQDDHHVWNRLRGSQPEFSEGIEIFLTRWLKVPSFSLAFSGAIKKEGGMYVLINHTVVGFSGLDGEISSVKISNLKGELFSLSGDTFIVAAGTIETARLLLHSAGSVDWQCPWRDNANIGIYFQDHIAGKVASVEPLDKRRFFDIFSTVVLSGHKYQPKIRIINEVLKNNQILNVQGMFMFESSVSENLVYLKQFVKAALYSRKVSSVRDLLANTRGCAKYLLPIMLRYIIDHRIFVPGISKISLQIQAEQIPLKESRIKIDPGFLDKNGMPRVVLDWKLSGVEMESIREFVMRADRAFSAKGLARLIINKDLMLMNSHFMDTLQDNYHQTGGARMGVSPQDGVVDKNLKVFGTKNLYIAGPAIFRTVGNANVTFTALALATRLADHLTLGQNAVH